MRHLTVTDSEIIESIGFGELTGTMTDAHLQDFGVMEVIFKASPEVVYRYHASAWEFAVVVAAPSIGKAFHDMFRKTKRPFTKSDRPKKA